VTLSIGVKIGCGKLAVSAVPAVEDAMVRKVTWGQVVSSLCIGAAKVAFCR